MADEGFRKISFELEQDADGYPPDRWESLWAFEAERGFYLIDSIPFYVKGISSEDRVSVTSDGNELSFDKLVKPSLNSVFRLYLSDASEMQAVRHQLRELGCESELSHLPKLVTFEIPGRVDFNPVANFLGEGAASGRWEYEEGVLRHKIAV